MTKKKIKYTDMCIYVDTHYQDPEADVAKIYNYLFEIAFMLAKKKNFFKSNYYYTNFAHFFASLTYLRLTSPKTKLDPSDPQYLRPLKSCLNYMKKTLYAKKCFFSRTEFNFTTQESDLDYNEAIKDNFTQAAYNSNIQLLKIEVSHCLSNIGNQVKYEIEKGWYGGDKALSYNLYLSVMISLLKSFTLSRKNKLKLINKKETLKYRALHKDNKIIYKNNYENLLHRYMKEELEFSPTLYNLDRSYLDYVAFIAQKIRLNLIKNIKNLISDYDLPEYMLEDIISLDAKSQKEN